MTAADDRTVGELARGLEAIVAEVKAVRSDIANLSTTFTPREVHDLALGGVKIDIRRQEEDIKGLEKRQEATEKELDRRFRQAVLLTLTSLAGPLTVGIVLFVLNRLVTP